MAGRVSRVMCLLSGARQAVECALIQKLSLLLAGGLAWLVECLGM